MKRMFCILFLGAALSQGTVTPVAADEAADRAAITKAVASYTAAFNAHDAKALAAHWSPEAVYINPQTGARVEGREAITKEFGAILEGLKKTKLAVTVESIRFISPSVAVENGLSNLVGADGKPQQSTYAAIHIKRDGKWLLDRVTERDVPVVQSHYEHLKDLEWMVGSWVDEDDQTRIETKCEWTRNKNFLTRTYTVTLADRAASSGMQLIGWDPAQKTIRSWIFDSNGGFAEGTWTKKDNRWFIKTAGTLPDGGSASFVNVITVVDRDQFKWRSIGRTVDGSLQPNIGEVVVVRDQSAD